MNYALQKIQKQKTKESLLRHKRMDRLQQNKESEEKMSSEKKRGGFGALIGKILWWAGICSMLASTLWGALQ